MKGPHGPLYTGPILPTDPPARPEMREAPELSGRPTWQELAHAYAEVANDAVAHRNAVYRELDEMRAAIILLDARFETRMNAAVEEITRRVRGGFSVAPASGTASAVHQAKPASYSLSEYNPEQTPAHGIRLEPIEWGKIQDLVADLQREREEAAAKAHDEEMRRKGAEEYAAHISRSSDLRVRNLKAWVAVVGAVLAVLEGLSRVFLH